MSADFHSVRSDPRERAIVWLRRDLRLDDNVAIAAAARDAREICLAFVLDPAPLGGGRFGAPIVQTFYTALNALREVLRERGSDLALLEGDPREEIPRLARRLGAGRVHFNDDYEPAAIRRDDAVERALRSDGVDVRRHLDHVYLGADEVLTDAGGPYKVFTPYYRRWLDYHRTAPRAPVPSARGLRDRLLERTAIESRELGPNGPPGFDASERFPSSGESIARKRLLAFSGDGGGIERYVRDREFPAIDGTSRLSPHLRAGTIGIRTCVARARDESWLRQLAWRDFYQAILRHFPRVDGEPFLPAAAKIRWSGDRRAFEAWCEGRTGYPIVDAAMRQLNATGWMHNRLRMIAASFLCKDLLIDWRWGERYFEQRLADADLAQNNGGWQWAASTGTDSAPYFRIFNPVAQGKKFDSDGTFVRAFVPELNEVPDRFVHEPWLAPGAPYAKPIVDRAEARGRALAAYGEAFGAVQSG